MRDGRLLAALSPTREGTRWLALCLMVCVVAAVASPHTLRKLVFDPTDSTELRESGRSDDHTTMLPIISQPPLVVMAIARFARTTFVARWYVHRALLPAHALSRMRHPLDDENPPPDPAVLT